MSKIKIADFYYGAVLSMLFNNRIIPALVEGDDDRQVYDMTTNKGSYRLFIKYRADKQSVKTPDYNSWVFTLTDTDKKEIQSYIDNSYNLVLALVCGVSGLNDSEIAVLDKDQIRQILGLGKNSITISRKKSEHAYRISIGGGRNKAIQIKTNQFEEIF